MKEKRHCVSIIIPEAIALRELRIEKGLSARSICKEFGKSEGFLRHIETGRRDFPKMEIVMLFLNRYGIDLETFKRRVQKIKREDKRLEARRELYDLVESLPEHKVIVALNLIRQL